MEKHATSARSLSIRLARIIDAPVVMLTGDVDLSTVEQLAAALEPLHGHVVVDLDGVSFLDRTGVEVFAAARRRLVAAGGTLHLRAPRDHIRSEFEILGIDDWIIDVRTPADR
jgi:stage II sporulation protein AA (anti-sigma F factor antagonist)